MVVVIFDGSFEGDVGVLNVLVSAFPNDPPFATISPLNASR